MFMIDFFLSLEQNKELVRQKFGIPINQTFELINKQYNATVDEISLFKENDQIEIILQNMDTGHRTSQLSIIPKQQIFPNTTNQKNLEPSQLGIIPKKQIESPTSRNQKKFETSQLGIIPKQQIESPTSRNQKNLETSQLGIIPKKQI